MVYSVYRVSCLLICIVPLAPRVVLALAYCTVLGVPVDMFGWQRNMPRWYCDQCRSVSATIFNESDYEITGNNPCRPELRIVIHTHIITLCWALPIPIYWTKLNRAHWLKLVLHDSQSRNKQQKNSATTHWNIATILLSKVSYFLRRTVEIYSSAMPLTTFLLRNSIVNLTISQQRVRIILAKRSGTTGIKGSHQAPGTSRCNYTLPILTRTVELVVDDSI